MADSAKTSEATKAPLPPKDCFIVMPIAETDGYPDGHFRHVYDDIIAPSCKMAGVAPVRADDVKATNLIHLDILRKLIDAPISICDLSTRNPNVLFELGIRQAFDRPVVLIQETGTPKIFDIAPLRYLEYSRDMRYHEVMTTQLKLSEAIKATMDAQSDAGSVNSIVKLLALTDSAKIPDLKGDKESVAIDFLRAEMHQLRRMLEVNLSSPRQNVRGIAAVEYERISTAIERASLANSRTLPAARLEIVMSALNDLNRLMPMAESKLEHGYLRNLMEKGDSVHSKILKEMDEIPF